MKKTLASAALALLLLVSAAPQVLALEIVIDQTGTIHFYEDVLGDTDEKDESEESEVETMELKTEKEDKPRPEKTIKPQEKSELKVKMENEKVEVEVERRGANAVNNFDRPTEKMETQKLRVRMPSDRNPEQAREAMKKAEELRAKQTERQAEILKKIASRSAEQKLKLEEALKEREQKAAEVKAKLEEERQKRTGEEIEIRSKDVGENKRLEIQSRQVRAESAGADFKIDPATKEVKLITPNGNEQVLNHLPDQAVEKIQARVQIKNTTADTTSAPVEIVSDEAGNVLYKAQATENKRFLGVFKVPVEKEVFLDDTTGDVIEKELPPNSLFQYMVRLMSI